MAWTKETEPTTNRDGQTVVVMSEEVIDDSDKTLSFSSDVGIGEKAEILGVRFEFTTTATVGNRRPAIRILDSAGDIVSEIQATTVVAASQTSHVFDFHQGIAPATGEALFAMESLPPKMHVLAGQSVQFLDAAAVDSAADDMIVHATLGAER